MKTNRFLILFASLAVGTANAGMAVNVLGGLSFNNPAIDPEPAGAKYSASAAVSYGATVEAGGSAVGFETGLISAGQKQKYESGGTGATIASRAWVIPAMVRFKALPVIDFGVGGYYAILPDKFTVEDSTIALLPNGEYENTDAKSDFGVRASVRLKFPVAPAIGVLFDANYAMGLKDLDESIATKKTTREYGALAGVSLGF